MEIIRCASMPWASPHSGQATATVAVGVSRSLSATIITLTPHLRRQVDTIVITLPGICYRMYGTFNGVPLRNITSVRTISLEGLTRDTFRVVGGPFPALEQHLRLNGPGVLLLSSQEIEGRV